MVGDSVAAGARVEARGMSPVHLAAMQGVVLGGEGQWLPFLRKRHTQSKILKTHNQTEAFKGVLIIKCQKPHYALSKV